MVNSLSIKTDFEHLKKEIDQWQLDILKKYFNLTPQFINDENKDNIKKFLEHCGAAISMADFDNGSTLFFSINDFCIESFTWIATTETTNFNVKVIFDIKICEFKKNVKLMDIIKTLKD